MVPPARRLSRLRTAAERADRNRVPGLDGAGVHDHHPATVLLRRVAKAEAGCLCVRRASDRRSLARAGDTAQSPAFRVLAAQRAWRVSRVFLVLLFQRTLV